MNTTIKLFVTFIVCLFAGQAGAVALGLAADQVSSALGLAVFIPIYYAMFWVAWRVALLVVDRETGKQAEDARGQPRTNPQ